MAQVVVILEVVLGVVIHRHLETVDGQMKFGEVHGELLVVVVV